MAKGSSRESEWKQYKAQNEARNRQNTKKKQERAAAGQLSTQMVLPGDCIVKINQTPVEVPQVPTTCDINTIFLKYDYIQCVVVNRNGKHIRIMNPKLTGFGFTFNARMGGIMVKKGAEISEDPKRELRWDIYTAFIDEDGVPHVDVDPTGILGKDLGDLQPTYGKIMVCILNHSSGYKGSRLIYSKGCNPHLQVHVLRDPDTGYRDFYLMEKDADWNWIPKRRINPEEFPREFPKEILEYLMSIWTAKKNQSIGSSWGAMR